MKLEKRVLGMGVYASIVTLALAFPARCFAASDGPLKIAYSMLSKETATAWVAEERGFLKKYGLATDMVLIQTGTTLIQALVGGDVDIGFTAPPAVVSAAAGDSIPGIGQSESSRSERGEHHRHLVYGGARGQRGVQIVA